MQTITARNVNDAFAIGIMYLNNQGVRRNSRNGPVLELPTPLSVEYKLPQERVLFDKKRAINPFLHFFEPLWILAGRSDVKFLSDIVSRFKEYSDNGTHFHGAYGQRLRGLQYDQVAVAIEKLRANPDDRRVVLMINHEEDTVYTGKDRPCNIAITCKVRDKKLNICVYNRSNDFIWGLAGANMPQFSVLQEYMAGYMGYEVGTYHQITDNCHVYTDNPQWELLKDTPITPADPYMQPDLVSGRYPEVRPFPLFAKGENPNLFDYDLIRFFSHFDLHGLKTNEKLPEFRTTYFREVVSPMWSAFTHHKGWKSGLQFTKRVAAEDWRLITTNWLKERE